MACARGLPRVGQQASSVQRRDAGRPDNEARRDLTGRDPISTAGLPVGLASGSGDRFHSRTGRPCAIALAT
jgi:hypothetical protein